MPSREDVLDENVQEDPVDETEVQEEEHSDYITTQSELDEYVQELLPCNLSVIKGMGPVTVDLLGRDGITSIRELLETRVFETSLNVDTFSKAQMRAFLHVCNKARAKSVGLNPLEDHVSRCIVWREKEQRNRLRMECEALSAVVSDWSDIQAKAQEPSKEDTSTSKSALDLHTIMLVTILIGVLVSFYV